MLEKYMFDNLKLYQYFQRCEAERKEEARRKRAEDDGPCHEEAFVYIKVLYDNTINLPTVVSRFE